MLNLEVSQKSEEQRKPGLWNTKENMMSLKVNEQTFLITCSQQSASALLWFDSYRSHEHVHMCSGSYRMDQEH